MCAAQSPSPGPATWLALLKQSIPVGPAAGVYVGRNMQLAKAAADRLGADLIIVSAGLGFVPATTSIPVYEATIAGRDSVSSLFQVEEAAWFLALTTQSPYSTNWPSPDRQVFVAGSGPYIRMIEAQLANHPLEHLRLFTRSRSIPTWLTPAVMPYDDRLDGPDSPIPGTLSDFHSRALLHFVEEIWSQAPSHSLEDHRRRVKQASSRWTVKRRRLGETASDERILALISAVAPRLNHRSTAVLRHLRDELSVACEQKRFRRLFRLASAQGGQSCLPL